ncbi:MAG: hypothetical protein ACR2LR_17760 [Hassallia sp.]
MNSIRVANLCGGFLFGIGLLVNIDAIVRFQAKLIQGTIVAQSEKGGDALSFIDIAKNEEGLITFSLFQTGIGAALACLREKRRE